MEVSKGKTSNYTGLIDKVKDEDDLKDKMNDHLVNVDKDLQNLRHDTNNIISFLSPKSLSLRPFMILTVAGRANEPTELIRGTNIGYEMAIWAAAPPPAPDQELYFKMYVPKRWDGTTDPQLGILSSIGIGAEDVGDKYKFQFSWCTTNQGSGTDVVGTSVTSTTSEITVKAGGVAAYSAYDMWFVLDSDNATNPITAGCMLTGRIRRVVASANEVTNEPVLWDWVTLWKRDKFGGPYSVETNG